MTFDARVTTPDRDAPIASWMQELTLVEKVSLLAGASMWQTVPIERLDIPAIKVSDGPNGARGSGGLVGGDMTSACFPVGISLAATWNPDLIEQIGVAIGEEARTKNARMILGPTVNIHRSPLNGRNFECFSEDPYLSARIAVAYISGLQSQRVGAVVKHYICNDSEFERNTISSEVDERTLREIYLPPFAAAVTEAGTWGVMSGYNRVNGTYVGDDRVLLTDVLKHELGFDGIVMSDWFGTQSTIDAANNGLDLEMPGPAQWRGEQLLAAVEAGHVDPSAIDESVRRILHLIGRSGALDDPFDPSTQPEQSIDRPEHRALIRRAAAEGTVLLKNDGDLLPLNREQLTSIAIIGPNAKTAQIHGGGSSQVNAHHVVTPFDGILAAVGESLRIGYEHGCTNHRELPRIGSDQRPLTITYYESLDLSGESIATTTTTTSEQFWIGDIAPGVSPHQFSAQMTATVLVEESGDHEFSLMSAGLSRLLIDGELVIDNWTHQTPSDNYFGFGSTEVRSTRELIAGRSYEIVVEYSSEGTRGLKAVRLGYLPPVPEDAIARAVALAANSDVAVLFVGLNADWESEGYDRPNMDLVGDQDELVERVAAANPNTVVVVQTGSPVTMPWLNRVSAVVQAWYPGQECGNAIADVLFGTVAPSGKLPQTFPKRLEDNPAFINYPGENGRVRYGEGLFVGYRYYDKKLVEPLFPFGFGLAYTTFKYDNMRVSSGEITPNETLTVSVEVRNVGDRTGRETVQVYVRDHQSRLVRPEKELKGFVKVEVEPGQSVTATINLARTAFAYWDDAKHIWVAEAGEFEVLVGSSAADILAQATVRLTETLEFGGPTA